ncbi:RseA-like anti sigma(E) protein [Mesocricetibacter intestinalis]|uniref:Anti-sigma-E factor RseA n=1 Tax=Mesocricetibacter intestinalis TaxID=1521930 RepID=A0A4R6V6U6_9PAST|nr:sigma-E factor negative regulatory protein [Mesocricetibacter intestinalis]TDQ56630.1 RseA-like anti sigma(E) protein [Mesocricetibacter intestinalis]
MQKELLSAYVDGEQVNEKLTAQLCQNAELQRTWSNYHAIRSLMRDESPVFLGADFTAKMETLIGQEEQLLVSQPMPEEVQRPLFIQKVKKWFAPALQVAVAAGVCLASVIGFQSLNLSANSQNSADTPVLQTLPFTNNVQEVSYNAPLKDAVTAEKIEQKNKRIGAMLQSYELQRRVYADSAQNQHK